MVTISTRRLVLREFTQADWASVHKYASDLEAVRYVGWGPNSEDDTKNFVQQVIISQKEEPRRSFTLAVTLKNQNTFIGACRISISDPQNREGSIGYIYDRNFWGQGYATEAMQAILAFGFEQLALHRISAWCNVDNTASSRVMEKNGMQREGRLREFRMQQGKWSDSFLYPLLDYEWAKGKTDKPNMR